MRLLMLLFLINCITFIHAQNPLFPISERGLKGFINPIKKGPLSINTKKSYFFIKNDI
jgi:hypothetical protein